MKRIIGMPDILPNSITRSTLGGDTTTKGWTVRLAAVDEETIFMGVDAHLRAIEYAKERYGAYCEPLDKPAVFDATF